ncbi:putative transcriptional regulator [Neorhizobium galegae]|uniref:CopG family ribbon-helix-helix protein n=1 Tax=Neorhizobium galegae TaxID=399 RepID=UPI001AE94B11|nr:ribbon-helix-helix protein, CopG family [Neorhizobium galegae]MBP2549954.1 putative transcriptional regulator [Neorhizobium galegae]
MKTSIDLPDDISRRIDQLAERTSLTRSRIVEDALSHGRSLAWQEKWIAGVQAGIADADKDEFASPADIDALLTRYDQV